MKFPDKPIATAGIGVACALALLVLLSWPALFGATNSADHVTSGVPAANSGTTTYETASSTSQVVSSATAVETAATTISTIAAGSAVNNSSNASAPTSGSTISSTMSSTTSTALNGGGTTITNLESLPSAQPVFAFNYATSVASGSSHYSAFITLAVISITSLIIAIGSMLFVSRRVNSGKARES
ncbi:MAG: hypothetical protein ACYCPW_10580 [Nitrososphaerales archaeon]